jgi:polyphosphate kinase 2 (PPK2 family)
MLLRTSTPSAPWTIVEAEDKRYARIKVLRTVVRRLEEELGRVKL